MAEDTFIPAGAEAPDADEAFAQLEGAPASEDLIVEEHPPAPLGRSWAYDFTVPGFDNAGGGGLVETRGLDTLRQWITKCLVTARGAHPIHPDAYGLEAPFDLIGNPADSFGKADLEDRIENALTFHPRITGIEDFTTVYQGGDEALFISFTVLLDDEESLAIQGLRLI